MKNTPAMTNCLTIFQLNDYSTNANNWHDTCLLFNN